MNGLYFLYTLFGSILIFFLFFPFVTVLIAWIKGKRKQATRLHEQFDFGCIITAYRNAEIAYPLVESLLRQSHERLMIYLVADHCPTLPDSGIRDERFILLKPAESLHLKVKSILYAMEQFRRLHDYVVIFDADNLAHPNFLAEINRSANEGHLAIQGQRTAKNLDTRYAAMDALGEFYKNYIERHVTWLLGSSSVISGSGMAVETGLYKAYLACPEIERGKHFWKKMLQEDKILQNFLLRDDHRIAYAKNAICYDEKVTTASAVETQRSRWLFSYFQNVPNALGILRRGLLHFSWNQIYFGLVTIAPPLFLLVFSTVFMIFWGWWISPKMAMLLTFGLFTFALNILLTLQLSHAPLPVWKSVLSLPVFIFRQVTALTKMSNPNRNFKHTEHHRKISIEEVLSQKL